MTPILVRWRDRDGDIVHGEAVAFIDVGGQAVAIVVHEDKFYTVKITDLWRA